MGSVGLEIGLNGSRGLYYHSLCQKMLDHRTFITALLIFLNLAIFCKADDDKNYVERNKRFFFISSSSTTSTVTTTTVCWFSSVTAQCTGRRRRAMIDDTVQPAPTSVIKSNEAEKEI